LIYAHILITVFALKSNVKRDLHEAGAVPMQTLFGNTVIAYDLERTMCGCIYSRNQSL